jgi:hypothetical protein
MGLKQAIFCSGLVAAAMPATAAFTLDFEGIGNTAAINGFYGGGTDSLGNSGNNFGVQFGSNTLGLIDADAGGSGNFANEPSPNTAMFFLTGTAVLNYEPGFAGGFSFYYSSRTGATVNVYDGLDASGNVIGTIQLENQSAGGSCQGDPNGGFCNWTLAGATFSGLAKSIDFGGTVNRIAYDNMKFGIDTPPGPPGPGPVIPPVEPGPIVLPPGTGNGACR